MGIKEHGQHGGAVTSLWSLGMPAKGSSTQMHAGKQELWGTDQSFTPLGYTQGSPVSVCSTTLFLLPLWHLGLFLCWFVL